MNTECLLYEKCRREDPKGRAKVCMGCPDFVSKPKISTCTCSHERGYHYKSKGPCALCKCQKYRSARGKNAKH